MSDPRSIVIIGAGECGIRAALTLRDEGYTGEIALIHGEAVEPYEKPPLSKPGPDGISIKPISGTDRILRENISVSHDQRVIEIDRVTKRISLTNVTMVLWSIEITQLERHRSTFRKSGGLLWEELEKSDSYMM